MDSLDFLTFFWAPILKSVTNTFSSLKKRGIQLVSHSCRSESSNKSLVVLMDSLDFLTF